ncbi:hypothetical protein ACLX1H_000602 [Fusarium chlamydosporum]
MRRCRRVGLDGWSAPRIRKSNVLDETLYILFRIDTKRENPVSVPKDEALSSPQSVTPSTLSTPADQSKPMGCFPGPVWNVRLNKIAITENERRGCAKSCAYEGKTAVVFSGLRCGCTDSFPKPSTRVDDISCVLQATNKAFRNDRFYSVWSTCVDADSKTHVPSIYGAMSNLEGISAEQSKTSQPPRQACYRSPTRAKDRIYKRYGQNNPRVCHRFCSRNNKRYVFLQGTNCWCSNTYPDKSEELTGDQCDWVCAPNDIFKCGGDRSQSVYNLGISTDSAPRPNYEELSKRPTLGKVTSHGCFNNPPSAVRYERIKGPNSARGCAGFCRRKNTPVALLRMDTCICADTYPGLEYRSSDSECSLACPGYPSDTCGGSGAFSVINTGLRVDVPNEVSGPVEKAIDTETSKNGGFPGKDVVAPTYEGCYRMESSWRNYRLHHESDFVERCASKCKSMGKAVSALQRNICLCTDTLPRKDTKADTFHCDIPCRKPNYGKCGGSGTWSFYNSGLKDHVTSDPSLKPAHGCFKFRRYSDRHAQRTSVAIHGPNRSPDGNSCTTQCAKKGFSVALRHASACFCSPELPPESDRLEDKTCFYTCRGDRREMCGGPSLAYTVYKTSIYIPDLHKEDKSRGVDPSSSLNSSLQCLNPALEKAYQVFDVVSRKVAAFTQKLQDGFFWVRDQTQHV